MVKVKEKMGKIVADVAIIVAAIVLLGVLGFLFNVAIVGFNSEADSEVEAAVEDRFVTLSCSTNYYIVYDKETMVQYAVSNGSYNRGTFVMLVDKDGKPLIYEGGK